MNNEMSRELKSSKIKQKIVKIHPDEVANITCITIVM